MVTTKTKPNGWMLRLLSALFLISCFTACDSTEGTTEEKPDKPKPEVPVNDGDWQTVPATGGTITKDDITIDFPSGTFAGNAKVAITEVKKGESCGEYEVSKFYQISMPCNATKPISFKMKSKEKNDDISFVAHAKAFCQSDGKEKKTELQYNTTYSNGEYSATMPAVNGGVEDQNVYFTIGLRHQINYPSGNSRTRGLYDAVICEGKVKNINYKLRFSRWTLHQYREKWDSLVMVEQKAPKVEEYVKQAITKIIDLGFVLEGDKILYIDFAKDEDQNWGGHVVCGIPGNSGYSMWVTIGIQKLLSETTTDSDIKCTVIHEVFHWFQSFYDPRANYQKSDKKYAGDEVVLYEMGAVWIEQFMNDGNLKTSWLMSAVFDAPKKIFNLGLADYFDLWDKETIHEKYQYQGYSMAPLLYYLCSTKEMEAFKFNNNSVVELHKEWENLVSIKSIAEQTTTLEYMERWVERHDSHFFMGDQIDDYYIKFLTGKVVKGLHGHLLKTPDKNVKDQDEFSFPFDGKLYPYGCEVKRIFLAGLKDKSLKKKNLILKQESEGVQTYLLVSDRSSENEKYKKVNKAATVGDSIVLDGETLESLRLEDGTYSHSFYIVTTRTSNYPTDKGTKPWKVTIELKDNDVYVDPTELEFPGEGGTQDVKVNYGTYTQYGYKIEPQDTAWINAKNIKKDGGVYVSFTVKPNTTMWDRETTVYCFVTNVDKSTDKDRVYLPVKIKQKAAEAPSVNPSSLTFESTGGTEKVTITANGYKKFGHNKISSDYSSWLSATNIKGGIVEITAQPNTTGQDRTGEVICYVTNEDNPTDAQKYPLPVKITQKANTEVNKSDIKVTKVNVENANLYLNCKEPSSTESIFTGMDGFNFVEDCSFTQSGSTLHVSATYNYKSVSFDLVNLTLNNQDYIIKNFKYTELVPKGKNYKVELGDIPLSSKKDLTDGNRTYMSLGFNYKVSEGLKVLSYSNVSTSDGRIWEYVDKPTNSVNIWLTIDYTKNK